MKTDYRATDSTENPLIQLLPADIPRKSKALEVSILDNHIKSGKISQVEIRRFAVNLILNSPVMKISGEKSHNKTVSEYVPDEAVDFIPSIISGQSVKNTQEKLNDIADKADNPASFHAVKALAILSEDTINTKIIETAAIRAALAAADSIPSEKANTRSSDTMFVRNEPICRHNDAQFNAIDWQASQCEKLNIKLSGIVIVDPKTASRKYQEKKAALEAESE